MLLCITIVWSTIKISIIEVKYVLYNKLQHYVYDDLTLGTVKNQLI